MSKPRLLDLFCGAGGAAVGYSRAGFEVVGVDKEDQPNYPFRFIKADALWIMDQLLGDSLYLLPPLVPGFDAIHASPPCQAYTSANRKHPEVRAAHPALIEPTRERLVQTAVPWVIENVPAARPHLEHPIQVCGRSVGVGTHRHRLFETNWPAMTSACSRPDDGDCAVYGKLDGRRLWTRADGTELRAPRTLEEAQAAMGIDWMTWDELREAIPPAYTEMLGAQLMRYHHPKGSLTG